MPQAQRRVSHGSLCEEARSPRRERRGRSAALRTARFRPSAARLPVRVAPAADASERRLGAADADSADDQGFRGGLAARRDTVRTMRLAIYAVDVGSIRNKRLGWARAYGPMGRVDPAEAETEIERLVDQVSADLDAGWPVALGFECPLDVPVSQDPQLLGVARIGEGNRSWSAGAGTGALATGLVQAAWTLRALRAKAPDTRAFIDWQSFERAQAGLSCGRRSCRLRPKPRTSHTTATPQSRSSASSSYRDPADGDDLDAERPLSLIAAAALERLDDRSCGIAAKMSGRQGCRRCMRPTTCRQQRARSNWNRQPSSGPRPGWHVTHPRSPILARNSRVTTAHRAQAGAPSRSVAPRRHAIASR